MQLEELAGRAGRAVCLEAGGGPAARPIAGVCEEAKVGGWREAGMNRRVMRRLCELDKAEQDQPVEMV